MNEINELPLKLRLAFQAKVTRLNDFFNRMPKDQKRISVLVFVISVALTCGFRITIALIGNSQESSVRPTSIELPRDTYMKDDLKLMESQLTPVGKMKGEIDGEFESFYVAVDFKGGIFINRDIEYSENAYEKSDEWKQISNQKLMEYEKQLHFIPFKTQGIKR